MESPLRKWAWISLLLSGTILIAVLLLTINKETFEYLKSMNIWFLILALIVRTFSLAFWAERIKLMARSLGYSITWRRSLTIVLLNLFPGAITPGQIGGEPVRVHELSRDKIKVGDATALVIGERIMDAVVLTLMALLALVFLAPVWKKLDQAFFYAFIITWVMMFFVIAFFLYLLQHPTLLKRIITRITGWLERRRSSRLAEAETASQGNKIDWLHRIDQEMENFQSSIKIFTRTNRLLLVGPFMLTAGFWISEFFVASLILMGLSQPPYIAESFLFQLIVAIINMVPLTPGSAGVAEISAITLYSLIIPSAILGIFVVLWRFLLFYFNIIAGFLTYIVTFKRQISKESKE